MVKVPGHGSALGYDSLNLRPAVARGIADQNGAI